MRHDYQLITFGTGGYTFGNSHTLPSWADFVEVENDGGRPLVVHFGGAEPIKLRTGARIPLITGALRCTRDTTENTSFAPRARVAILSSQAALITPPPLRQETRPFQTRETVVQAAAAREITKRAGILVGDLRALQAGQAFYVAETQAKATAALGIEMNPGDIINEWDGPLWVFNPAGVNSDFDWVQHVKEMGDFSA